MSEKPREQEPQPEQQPFKKVQKTPEQRETVLEQKLEVEKFLIDILTRVHPQEESDDIRFIVRHSHSSDANTEFSENWARFLSGSLLWGGKEVAEKISSIFTEKINDKVLIDLGGGREMMRLVLGNKGFHPKYYINIDKFNFDKGQSLGKKTSQGFSFGVAQNVWRKEKNINRLEVSAEMLNFLQYVDNESVDAISLNGIDAFILTGPGYDEELFKQIKRVLKPGGIILGIESEVFDLVGKDNDFKTLWEEDPTVKKSVAFIFEKGIVKK